MSNSMSLRRDTYIKDQFVPHWRDRSKLCTLKDDLYSKAALIVSEQGYVKDIDVVKNCIAFIDRGYLPAKFCGSNVKKARKLHESLKRYLYSSGFLPRLGKRGFTHLQTEYKFMEDEIKLQSINRDLKDIITVNVPEGDIDPTMFKLKTLHLADEEEHPRLKSKSRKALNSLYSSMCLGSKFVDKRVSYIIKLKKKYTKEEDLWLDLYAVYKNWKDSKVRSHEKHVLIDRSYKSRLGVYKYRRNKANENYYLGMDQLKKLVKGDEIPYKRFRKIIYTLRGIYNRKAVRNNGHVDALVSKVQTVSTKEDTGVVKDISKLVKFKANAELWGWLNKMVRDLVRSKYLSYYDVQARVGQKRIPGPPILFNMSITDKELSDIKLMPKFRKRTDKLYTIMKNAIIRECIEKYFDEEDVVKYKYMLDDLKANIKNVFSSSSFKDELARFVFLKEPKICEDLPIPVADIFEQGLEEVTLHYPDEKCIFRVNKVEIRLTLEFLQGMRNCHHVTKFLTQSDIDSLNSSATVVRSKPETAPKVPNTFLEDQLKNYDLQDAEALYYSVVKAADESVEQSTTVYNEYFTKEAEHEQFVRLSMNSCRRFADTIISKIGKIPAKAMPKAAKGILKNVVSGCNDGYEGLNLDKEIVKRVIIKKFPEYEELFKNL